MGRQGQNGVARAMSDMLSWAARLAPRIPHRLRGAASMLAGTLAWALARQARSSATANVRHVHGHGCVRPGLAGRLGEQAIVRRIFCNMILNYLDLFTLPTQSPGQVAETMSMAGTEVLDEALSLGRGVVLASAHLGPFEHMTPLVHSARQHGNHPGREHGRQACAGPDREAAPGQRRALRPAQRTFRPSSRCSGRCAAAISC